MAECKALSIIVAALMMAACMTVHAADRFAAGWRHSVALDEGGLAWTWGDNALGQLGDRTFDRSMRPVPVVAPGGEGTLTDVVAVAAGSFHTLAVRPDGTLWAWGNNAFGQLGNGEAGLDAHSPVPVQVRGPGGEGFLTGVVAAAGGWDHSVAVLQDGSVWAWGSACQGQLGDGTRDSNRWEVFPVQVETESGPLTGVTAVACGAHHTIALREDGTVWAWGANFEGQLGAGLIGAARYPHQFRLNLSWTPPSPGRWTIKLGYTYTDPSHLYAADRLELSDEYADAALTVTDDAPREVVERTTATRRRGDQVDSFVQMASTLAYPSAAQVGRRVALRLEDVRVGLGPTDNDYAEDVHLVLTNEATGETVEVRPPTPGSVAAPVVGPEGEGRLDEVTGIAAGLYHSIAVRRDGTAWTWGYNGGGQLGVGTRESMHHGQDMQAPLPVQMLGGATRQEHLAGIVAVAASYENSYALDEEGRVWACGWNVYGGLGIGTAARHSSSRVLAVTRLDDGEGVEGVVALAAGKHHVLARDADGALWGWGHNGFGQLGDGTPWDREAAVRTASLTPTPRSAAPQAEPAPDAPAQEADFGDARVFNVRDHGAVGDGLHLDTEALQAAIDAAHAAGGGVALVRPGTYRTGTLELMSNVRLHLERGATLLGSANREHYAPPRHGARRAVILANRARNIALTGEGVIDGQGGFCPNRGWRHNIIVMTECEDITVEGVSTVNAGSWTQHYILCRDLTIRNVTVNSIRPFRNNDGLDFSGCENVLIEGCTIISDDDAIVIKSQSADRVNRNIRAVSNTTYSFASNFKIGTETRGVTEDIVCEDLRAFGGTTLGIYSVDGTHLSGVRVERVWAEASRCALGVRLGARLRESYFGEGEERVPGILRGVTVRDVDIHLQARPLREVLLEHGIENAELAHHLVVRPVVPSFVSGLPDHPAANVTLANVRLSDPGGGAEADAAIIPPERPEAYPAAGMFGVLPAWAFYLRHAEGVVLHDVRLELRAPDGRPPLAHENVHDLTVDGLAVHEAWR